MIAGYLSNVTITSHMSPFWTFRTRASSVFEKELNMQRVSECSVLRDVLFVLDTNKTYPKDVTIFSLFILI